ncbi:MAG: hypothetical protein IKY97_07790 [Mailhella sp.]|nr:hypothetical protein [Mailhella sp.]
MLTEAEKKWLEEREKTKENNGYYFCAFSELQSAAWNTERGWLDVPWVIDTKDTYKDAAEFEARVAAKCAAMHWDCVACPGDYVDDCEITDISCTETRLKHARIAVEEEMQ